MKSTDRILAKRYARAYDELSKDNDSAVQACQALSVAAQALKQAQSFMCSPAVSPQIKQNFVRAVFGKQPQVEKFLCTLLQAKRYYLLDTCVTQVQRLADERQGIVRARVETAFALSAEQKKKTEEILSRFSGKQARAQFAVRPELLGGLRACMEDIFIDGSLQGKFKKLEEELIK